MTTALHLLETLATHEGATLSELARHADLTHNQTFRLLATFEAVDYVLRERGKTYRLGPKLHLLGLKAAWPHNLILAAAEQLTALSELSRETVLLSVPAGTDRLIVDARASQYSLRVEYTIGSRLPMYVGGMGIALLAFSPLEIQAQVLAKPRHPFTTATLVDDTALREELTLVRARGVRISRDDYTLGEFSVAAAILGPDGFARGALNIAGFTARLDAETEERYVEAVVTAANRVTQKLT